MYNIASVWAKYLVGRILQKQYRQILPKLNLSVVTSPAKIAAKFPESCKETEIVATVEKYSFL